MNDDRLREAESQLFSDAGINPREKWLDLPRVGARTRVLEVGDGEPVVFLHGGPEAGATWAYVAAHLDGIRAILVDRPGCGLSAAPRNIPDASTLPAYVAQLTADLLDELGIARASLVGSSLGGYSALRSALALTSRVRGVFLAGCPPFVPGWTQIPFFTLLRAPVLGQLMVRMPATAAGVRMGLMQMGHAQALRAGTIPPAMLAWERVWQGHTATLRNDARMIRGCGTFLGGFAPHLDLRPDDLARVKAPVHLLVGTADPIGAEETGQRLVDLLPTASLEVLDGAGHLPWLDEPQRVARSVRSFALGLHSDH